MAWSSFVLAGGLLVSTWLRPALALKALGGSSSAGGAGAEGAQALDVNQMSKPIAVKVDGLQQNLMICNAYAHDRPLSVFRVSEGRSLTASGPLGFKECRDYPMLLQEGEQFEFKAGALSIGTFSATGLPRASTTLLLVPMRRNTESLTAKFMSHAFTDMDTSQVALVNAYRGADELGQVRIADRGLLGNMTRQAREEGLRFDSVVALNPGKYQVSLAGANAQEIGSLPLKAAKKSKHVVLRVGGDVDGGKALPQELVVFPQVGSEDDKSQSGCAALRVQVLGALAALVAMAQAAA